MRASLVVVAVALLVAGVGAVGVSRRHRDVQPKNDSDLYIYEVSKHGSPLPADEARRLAEKFAPQLRFAGTGSSGKLGVFWARNPTAYPYDPRKFYNEWIVNERQDKEPMTEKKNFQNTDASTMEKATEPLLYEAYGCSHEKRARIVYHIFYPYQATCDDLRRGHGVHPGDWEHIIVITNDARDAIDAVVFYQHGGHYTRFAGHFKVVEGSHPVVYVGKDAHGSYHLAGGTGTCLYWEDIRDDKGARLNSWRNLVDLYEAMTKREPWAVYQGNWGHKTEGIGGPMKKGKRDDDGYSFCILETCDGEAISATGLNPKERAAGCAGANCLPGQPMGTAGIMKLMLGKCLYCPDEEFSEYSGAFCCPKGYNRYGPICKGDGKTKMAKSAIHSARQPLWQAPKPGKQQQQQQQQAKQQAKQSQQSK